MNAKWSIAGWLLVAFSGPAVAGQCPAALDFHKRPQSEDAPVHLCEVLCGQVILIVNTASKCAFSRSTKGWNSCTRATATEALL